MNELQIGTIQKLTVLKKKTEGFVLTKGKEVVMLPNEDADERIELDDSIEVFLYFDKKGEKIATMQLPDITLESFGWAVVVEVVKNLGVFVDIGIDKEILVSKDDLPVMERVWPTVGDYLFVSLELDKKGRLLAKPITEGEVTEDIERAPVSLLKKNITARVYRAAKAGSFALTEEGYRAFIHPNERKREPRLGETIQGRVIDVKDDGTINVSLLPLKQESMIDDADLIMEYLEEAGGEIPFSDKSDPDDIRGTFHISKAAFKRALGKLMKENKVIQQDGKTIMTTKN
ncbi:S1 RNA-binding domain-containing protein [Thalassobacillus pellis]|uniref:CvfB family protein n=1 Tax=Thalassobacillus pellis TaxID=748008 RepID=UPI0019614B05|nr:S1-like domain-containing RNA-binding protein [Thalassobacillus pellis]MBM7552574.1 putative RNA-binding protein (virulence factor B family) [Thalassobacillus pellis]